MRFGKLSAGIIMLGASCFGMDTQQHNLVPRRVLLAHPDRCFVSMNHSGTKISFISRDNKDPENAHLCIADTQGKILLRFPVKFVRDLSRYKWAYTDRHLLILQDNNGDENNHIICVDTDNSQITDLTPFPNCKADIVKLSKKHPEEILIGLNKNDPIWYDLYKLNIKTGKITFVFQNREYSGFCCSTAPAIICDDDFNVRIVRKPLPDGSAEYYKTDNGKLELFEKISFDDSKTTEFLTIGSDGETLYKRDSVGRDKVALVAQNLKTKEKRTLFENSTADVGDLENIIFDERGNPLLLHFEYLKTELIALQKKAESVVSSLKKLAKDEVVRVLSVSNDRLLIGLESDVKATRYYIYEADRLHFLFSAQPELDKYAFSKMEPVIIKSRDGLDLICYLTKPIRFKKGVPVPLIVMPHGGPWYRDSGGFDKEVQLLANRGYAVLQVNYRGSTGFGKRFINMANNNPDKMHNDLLDAVNWAVNGGIASRDKVAICGWSYGGYAALRGLTHSPGVFCCAVDFIGPSNWLTVLKTVPSYWLPDIAAWYNWVGNPNTEEGKAQLLENSPITKIANVKKPVIIMQGANDPRVNKAESDQIVEALKTAGIPVTYVVYPNEGHGFLNEGNNISSLAFAEKFLANYLGGICEPISAEDLKNSSHKVIENAIALPTQ